jgi:hypothetical protein
MWLTNRRYHCVSCRFIVVALLGIASNTSGFSQLNNRSFMLKDSIESPLKNKLFIDLSTLGFFKNNEYFNNIADGYTLFGYHLVPALVFFPSENISLKAGMFAWQDFGNTKVTELQPVFTIRIQAKNTLLTFGTLDGPVTHRMVEPLYDFERQLVKRIENGTEVVYETRRLFADVWINWEDMLYRGEPFQEKISGGLSSEIFLLDSDRTRLSIPIQWFIRHHGGQIDASPSPLKTTINGALGVSLRKLFTGEGFWNDMSASVYFVDYHDLSKNTTERYQKGYGLYLNAGLSTRISDLLVSYWHGDQYITDYGGDMFSSVSSTFKHPDYYEKERNLILVRISKDFKLLDNFYITARFEPMFDFNNPVLEFSHGLYFNYCGNFFLGKTRK